MEKKLTNEVVVAKNAITDEEIVKALDICYTSPCCTNECPYFNKNGRNFCVESKAFYNDLKALINRLQDENERLTEDCESADAVLEAQTHLIDLIKKDKAELQKQVDELKNELQSKEISIEMSGGHIIKMNVGKWAEMSKVIEQQAVKDTAREIFDWLKSEVIMTEIPHCGELSEEDVEAVMLWQIEEHFKKRYGVEVE